MTEELIAKAKEAQSPEELLTLAHENGMEEFTKEDAEELYAQMHSTGELTDEEMESVSGGCNTSVGGHKYKIVNSLTKCFTGKYESGFSKVETKSFHGIEGMEEGMFFSDLKRTDNKSLRKTWANCCSETNRCGTCYHLGLKAGTGYCEVQYN